ncbi:hypothetical protein GTW69_03585 [Streptomyces sp. SID7760]|nr:hypothetical protein [Streptomyces sp. SID7760]
MSGAVDGRLSRHPLRRESFYGRVPGPQVVAVGVGGFEAGPLRLGDGSGASATPGPFRSRVVQQPAVAPPQQQAGGLHSFAASHSRSSSWNPAAFTRSTTEYLSVALSGHRQLSTPRPVLHTIG